MSRTNGVSFDARGNPFPYEFIPLTFIVFRQFFVDAFADASSRRAIFDGYCRYNAALFRVIRADWTQWLNGSYTTRIPSPNDLDLVNIIRIEIIDANARYLGPFATGTGDPKTIFKVHGFIVPECPPSDYRYAYCVSKKAYWQSQFGKDRMKNPKGIVQVHQTGDV